MSRKRKKSNEQKTRQTPRKTARLRHARATAPPPPPPPPQFNSRSLRELTLWSAVLLAVLFATRLVNLWYDIINHDESTFILIASDLLAGNLPYTESYDMKPPGIFLALAAVMGVFGESMFAVRHFGTFCLLVAFVSAYAIAARHTTPLIAGLAVATVATLTGAEYFQPTLSEHGVIALLMPALWLLVAKRGVLLAVFVVGVLVSCATLTKTNVGYVALALGGYYLWRWWRSKAQAAAAWEVAAYIIGGLLPLAAALALYWAGGALDDFVLFNITLPAAYAYGQTGAWDVLLLYIARITAAIDNVYAVVVMLVCAAALCLWVAVARAKALLSADTAPLLLVFGALALSILHSGQGHWHYLLQLLPLLAVFTALGFGSLRAPRGAKPSWAGPALCAPALLLGLIHYGGASAYHLANRWDSLGNTPLQQAAALIREDADPRPVFAPQQHLIYWYLGQRPPSKMVHPSGMGGQGIQLLQQLGHLPGGEYKRVISGDYGYWVMLPDSNVWKYYHPDFSAWAYSVRDMNFALWKQVAAPDAQFAFCNGDVAERFTTRRDLPGLQIYKRRAG